MATFRNRCGKWRAEVYMRGQRLSATFDAELEAKEWAAIIEADVAAKFPPLSKANWDAQMALPARDFNGLELPEIVARSEPAIDAPGVYFLIEAGVIVYVGQSQRPRIRIAEHFGRFQFDSFAIVECEAKRLRITEAIYISRYRPKHNLCGQWAFAGRYFKNAA